MKFSPAVLFIILAISLIVPIASATTASDEYSSSGTWTCPAGVTTVTLDAIGGGSGGSGGMAVSGVVASTGVGGLAGDVIHQTLIPVTPGTSYTITIGNGGNGEAGWSAGGAAVHHGDSGGDTSALGYTASGANGALSNITYNGASTVTINGDFTGEDSTLGSFQVAENGAYGYDQDGAAAGLGYGAGGGGGGRGRAPATAGGTGGRGAGGYVRITYDSSSIAAYLNGYVMDSESGAGLSGATVQACQLSACSQKVSDGTGYFSIDSVMSVGYPLFMNTSKTGYNSTSITFVPFVSGIISNLNQTLLSNSMEGLNSTIGIQVRSPPYYAPSYGGTVHLQNISTGTVENQTLNIAGYGEFQSLIKGATYNMWANFAGYNSTVETVVAPTW